MNIIAGPSNPIHPISTIIYISAIIIVIGAVSPWIAYNNKKCTALESTVNKDIIFPESTWNLAEIVNFVVFLISSYSIIYKYFVAIISFLWFKYTLNIDLILNVTNNIVHHYILILTYIFSFKHLIICFILIGPINCNIPTTK